MAIEVLFYNRTDNPGSLYDLGDVVVMFPEGHVWGREEGLPKFLTMSITNPNLTVEQAAGFLEEWEDTDNPDADGDFPLIKRRTTGLDINGLNANKRNELLSTGHTSLTVGQLNAAMNRKPGA